MSPVYVFYVYVVCSESRVWYLCGLNTWMRPVQLRTSEIPFWAVDVFSVRSEWATLLLLTCLHLTFVSKYPHWVSPIYWLTLRCEIFLVKICNLKVDQIFHVCLRMFIHFRQKAAMRRYYHEPVEFSRFFIVHDLTSSVILIGPVSN